jgi:4-hydroxy-tetrahydrodipicolinate reductase
MINVGILGSKGRMGQYIEKLLLDEFSKTTICSARIDRDEDLNPLKLCDLVIDFSLPEGAAHFAKTAVQERWTTVPTFIVGSTGWKLEQKQWLDEYAKKAPVIMSSNFSLGVLAFFEALKKSMPLFEKLKFKPRIVETHHIHKKDAPSGTAVSIQRIISPMGPGNVPTQSIRKGEVIGEHQIFFDGTHEEIEFTHRAQDRSIFARGAIQVGLWATENRQKNPAWIGLHSPDVFIKAMIS